MATLKAPENLQKPIAVAAREVRKVYELSFGPLEVKPERHRFESFEFALVKYFNRVMKTGWDNYKTTKDCFSGYVFRMSGSGCIFHRPFNENMKDFQYVCISDKSVTIRVGDDVRTVWKLDANKNVEAST